MACPDDTQLSAFIARTLATPTAAQLEAHIADCDDCRNLLFALASSSLEGADAPAVERIGRFEVLDVIGQGAMGMVYRARDPELDRIVAIKVRRSQSRLDPDGEERLRREAQALARLAHPNVVAVYESGRFERSTYIVMEYVEGTSLEEWLKQSRSHAQILERMIEAGRGLAAAHGVGLVHRDFKPRNVFVATSGTAKVGDFGLVRLGEDVAAHEAPAVAQPLTLTMTGSMLGTPAYMSPEQLRGEPATERSDQFSFCVALHEVLYGRRPFTGTSIEGLLAAMTKPFSLPAVPRVPRSVARVLTRGLSIDPAQRFASMTALLDTLDDRATRRRRRGIAIGVAVAAAIVSGGVIAATRSPARSELCTGAEQRVATVWNAARKQELHAKFIATNAPFAEDAWRSVERMLDKFAGDWAVAHRGACEATRVRGEQSADVLDLRMWCLDDRLREISALTDVLAKADRKMVSRAVDAIGKLPDLEACADARTLAEKQAPRDAAQRQRVDALHAEIMRGLASARLGKLAEAVDILDKTAAAAKAEGYAPIEGLATLWLAQERLMLDLDAKAAEQTALQGMWAADRGRDDVLRARAWIMLTFIVGIAQNRFKDGHEHAEHARAAIRRLANGERFEGQLLGNEGQLLSVEGKFDEAQRAFEKASEILERTEGPNDLDLALLYAARSELASRQGNTKQALALGERAYAIDEHTYGPHHPETARSLFTIAKALEDSGEYDAAGQKLGTAIEIMEAALGHDHPDVAVSLDELGIVRRKQNRLDEALKIHMRSLEIREKKLPPDAPETSVSLDNVGLVLGMLDRGKEALPYHQRALAITQKVFGPDHIETAGSRGYLANAYLSLERYKEALTEFRAALSITEKALGPDDFDLSFYCSGSGRALAGLHRYNEAIEMYERALRLRGKDGDKLTTAELKFNLAEALWDSKRDRPRAKQLANEVRDELQDPEKQTEVAEWIATHK